MRVDLKERYSGVRVALFGCTGFIGRWVAQRLVQEGADLSCFARSPDRSIKLLARYGVRVPVLPAQLERRHEIAQELRTFDPQVTFNLMAYGVNPADQNEDLATEVNALFPEWLGRTLAESDARWDGNRLVHVGTQYEYGAVEEFHEDALPEPVTVYGESKLAGTEAVIEGCAETGLRAVVARVFNVFGPGEADHRLLPSLIRAAAEGQPLELTSGEQERDFCVVHDVAEGLLRLGAAPPLGGDPINLATGRLIRVKDFILAAAHQLQIDSHLLRFGARPDRPEEVLKPRVFVDRVRHLTGWLPETTVDEGIRRTVAFVPHDA